MGAVQPKEEFPKVVEVSGKLGQSVWNKWSKELGPIIGAPDLG